MDESLAFNETCADTKFYGTMDNEESLMHCSDQSVSVL